jgi:hypothetical protein
MPRDITTADDHASCVSEGAPSGAAGALTLGAFGAFAFSFGKRFLAVFYVVCVASCLALEVGCCWGGGGGEQIHGD